MVNYEWQDDGSWEYSKLVDTLPPIAMPLADGTESAIDHLPVEEARKTLGIWTNPAGTCNKQLETITSGLQTWSDRLSVGRLPAKWAWTSYYLQLWAKIRYGLGTRVLHPRSKLVG